MTLILSYNGDNWRETTLPQYVYDWDSANMALYKGKPVMIGATQEYGLNQLNTTYWRSNASYFETFDIETAEWSDLKQNPFFREYTRYYWEGTSVTKDDSFLVFGGRVGFYEDKSSQTR